MSEKVNLIKLKEFQDQKRLKNLHEEFKKHFNIEPRVTCFAPGRVNLIGEHIDYCGYGVLPMSIEQNIMVVMTLTKDNKIILKNIEERYKDFECQANEININNLDPKWHDYFLCGVQGISHKLEKPIPGLVAMVHGTVPPSAGLSSSSALVCSSALATMTTLSSHSDLTKLELAELCQKVEKYVGMEGGGMDQSIAFLAKPGKAMYVEFDPIRGTDVLLPSDGCFVVSNSMVEMNKAATEIYNQRVAECRLAAQILAKRKGKDWKEVKRLIDLQKLLSLSLDQSIELLTNQLTENIYSKQQICEELQVTESELNKISLGPKTINMKEFKLRQRAMHVFTEANRVLQFKNICNSSISSSSSSSVLEALGKVMDESHLSCRQDYDCSHPYLDHLVQFAKSQGAYGSRLTGAGWGGCCVHLVNKNNIDKFLKEMKIFYKEKRKINILNLKEKKIIYNLESGESPNENKTPSNDDKEEEMLWKKIFFSTFPGGGASVIENI